MGEIPRMNLKEWQKINRLSDSDIFSYDYLERIKLEPELVQCACGCGQLRLRFDKKGVERRYLQGHNPPCLPRKQEFRWFRRDKLALRRKARGEKNGLL